MPFYATRWDVYTLREANSPHGAYGVSMGQGQWSYATLREFRVAMMCYWHRSPQFVALVCFSPMDLRQCSA